VRCLIGPRLRVGLLTLLGLLLVWHPGHASAEIFRVAIVPFQLHSSQDIGYLIRGIRDMLSSRLASPDIELVEPSEVSLALGGIKKPLTPAKAAKVAERLQADFVIYGSVTKLGQRYSLNWQILNAASPERPTGLARTATEDELIPIIDEMAGLAREVISGRAPTILVARPKPFQAEEEGQAPETAPAQAEPEEAKLFARAGQPDPTKPSTATFRPQSQGQDVFSVLNVSPRPLAVATGDVDGDKVGETLLISEKGLSIIGFKGQEPELLVRLNRPLPGRLLMVSAGDVDGDGRAEIALTSLPRALPRSAIFKLKGRRLKEIAHLDRHHLRIIASPQGPILVGQEALLGSLFSGGFIRYSLTKGRLVRTGGIPGATDIEISTLALADITGDGNVESIGLGQTEKLTVVSAAGQVLFRSAETFGGTNNMVSLPDKNPQNEDINYSVNAAVTVDDIDEDGQPEVLVVHNHDTARRITVHLSHYRKGSVFVMKWTGHDLVPAWRTPQIEPYVAGAGLLNLADGQRLLVMAATDSEFYGGVWKLWKKTKGYLYRAPLTFEKSG